MPQSGTPVLIMAVAALPPLPAYRIGRRLPVPPVIFEILMGILVGPDVLGWAGDGQAIDTLSDLGPTMPIFLAGYETARPSPAPPSTRSCLCCATPGICTRASAP
jgi:Kef-type K+ transport system membrane component KefB